jgi:hypothetical protein
LYRAGLGGYAKDPSGLWIKRRENRKRDAAIECILDPYNRLMIAELYGFTGRFFLCSMGAFTYG